MRQYFFYKLILLSLFMGFCGITNGLMAQSNDSTLIKVKKCKDFEVTGKGSSANWNGTQWINIPPRTVIADKYSTKAKVLYSDTGIYFLFDCVDKKLTATMKADFMNLYEEDVVEVFLWTSEDFPVYFEYELSPLNFELPIMVPNYKGKFFGWLPWHYEGDRKTRHSTSAIGGKRESGADLKGWMAEFFIPFKLLTPLQQVPPSSGTKWRANMYRIDYDHKGETTFSWQKTKVNFHDYNSFGTFLFE
jgi:hypothetical protein